MAKNFKLAAEQIVPLINGGVGCYASDRITVDGCKVGYCYREGPDFDGDSGWRFFAGDETQGYADDSTNFEIYDVNTIANYDRDIIEILATEAPAAFERDNGGPLLRV